MSFAGAVRAASYSIACGLTLAVGAGTAQAQRYPLLDSTAVALLSGEISGDAAFDHVRALTSYHRPQGSDTLGVAARYVERMARAFGLAQVRYIELPSLRQTWNPGTSDLWIVGPQPERIASAIQNRIHLAGSTSTGSSPPRHEKVANSTTASLGPRPSSRCYGAWSGSVWSRCNDREFTRLTVFILED